MRRNTRVQKKSTIGSWLALLAAVVGLGGLLAYYQSDFLDRASESGEQVVAEDGQVLASGSQAQNSESAVKADAEVTALFEAKEKARLEAEEKARAEAEEEARVEAEEKARVDAEEQARIEAEEKARVEAEEKARLEAKEKARVEAEEEARLEAEEKARVEAEEKARLEAEEKARVEAEETARLEAEEKARVEAEEKARLEAEEKARVEADEKARLEAEEKARVEAEEKARLEAEEKARVEAEEKARLEAEEKARVEAEEKARLEAEEKARVEAAEKARLQAQAQLAAEEKTRKQAESAIAQLPPPSIKMSLANGVTTVSGTLPARRSVRDTIRSLGDAEGVTELQDQVTYVNRTRSNPDWLSVLQNTLSIADPVNSEIELEVEGRRLTVTGSVPSNTALNSLKQAIRRSFGNGLILFDLNVVPTVTSALADPKPEPLGLEAIRIRELNELSSHATNIEFLPGRWDVSSLSQPALDVIFETLFLYSEVSVIFEVHVNDTTSADQNLLISRQRARSIGRYLVRRGIDVSQIEVVGFGDTVIPPEAKSRVDLKLVNPLAGK